MSTPAPLTTTSYAILGLLAVRPFTTYELAQQMDRALGQFWPRARSKLYEEPKKLVAHGLATAGRESVGNRPRTVYRITRAGRRALRAWLSTPGDGPVIEYEQLVQVFLAEHGSRADLLATLEAARAWSDRCTLETGHVAVEYLEGRGRFPERLPWLVLAGEFLDRYVAMVGEWAEWASGVVAAWPDDLSEATPDLATLAGQVRRLEEVRARAEGPGGSVGGGAGAAGSAGPATAAAPGAARPPRRRR